MKRRGDALHELEMNCLMIKVGDFKARVRGSISKEPCFFFLLFFLKFVEWCTSHKGGMKCLLLGLKWPSARLLTKMCICALSFKGYRKLSIGFFEEEKTVIEERLGLPYMC